MKKLSLSIIAIAGIISAPLSFADDAAMSGFTSSIQSQNQAQAQAPSLNAASGKISATMSVLADTKTKIIITNTSKTAIKVEIPGTTISDYLNTNTHDYIRNADRTMDTQIVLKNAYGVQIWAGQVCNHTIIDVTNEVNTYNYIIDVDRFCR